MCTQHSLPLAIGLALLGSLSAYAQSDYPPGPPPGYGPPGYHHEDRWHRDDIRIVRAVYGAHGRYADVTEIVRHFARMGAPFEVSNETFGVDPYRGKTKHLRVTLLRPDGDELERSWEEGDTARF